MKNIRKYVARSWIGKIYYSFAIQLVLLHLRSQVLLTCIWVLLGALITGTIANLFGAKYLFWSPEYLGEVNFWSFFFLGFCFASFSMTWNLSTYMLSAHHFPFLATLKRPFTKYCINNFIIPTIFIVLILYYHIQFELHEGLFTWERAVYNCAGFIFGVFSLVLFLLVYFIYTNKDILSYTKGTDGTSGGFLQSITPGKVVDLDEIRSEAKSWRVESYLTESLLPRPVRSIAHYSLDTLMGVFKQNHTNALVVQLLSLVILVLLGISIENPNTRIPAGASVFLFMSIVVALIGAIIYWFHHWSFTVLVALFLVLNFLAKQGVLSHKNKAYGLDYTKERPHYHFDTLSNLFNTNAIEEDKRNTTQILERWKIRTGEKKPKMVLICVSGGGLKSATWAMQVIGTADSLTGGSLMRHTVLMSGASGGMIGMAYFRELYWRSQFSSKVQPYNIQHIYNISKDLLNPIAFTIVTNDLFMPKGKFKIGTQQYVKDRGYIFEHQLNENTQGLLDKSLDAYKIPEQLAQIPMLFITPYIVNDARRMVISPHKVAYMTIAPTPSGTNTRIDIDAIDFQRLFEHQQAQDVRMLSALRMNATYPYILPSVTLPTKPNIEVMDAGYRDNFGVESATRFITVFKDWIEANTSGVIIIAARGIPRNVRNIKANDYDGIIKSLIDPLGIAGKIIALQDFEHDKDISFLHQLLGKEKVQMLWFTYEPTTRNEEASMTFHLTEKERYDILKAIETRANQDNLQYLKLLLQN